MAVELPTATTQAVDDEDGDGVEEDDKDEQVGTTDEDGDVEAR